jgi:hypothetical protein
MSAPRIALDFAGARVRTSFVSVMLLVIGLAAAAAACLQYRAIEARRAGLELRLEALLRHSQHDPATDQRTARVAQEAGRVALELGTPWTGLLAELEVASRDLKGDIAVLSVEPDHEKHRVHITAESRDLPLALAYVQTLQASRSLRYPMLDSHEVRSDDPQRPVRFAMTAEWREQP